MKGELTAIIEAAPEGGYWAICPEVPGANGQGETIEAAKENLKEAVTLILQDRLDDIKRGLTDDVIIEAVPRHKKIKEPLAKKILKNLNV